MDQAHTGTVEESDGISNFGILELGDFEIEQYSSNSKISQFPNSKID